MLTAPGKPVCVLGTGHVGMACIIGLADLGHRVAAYDADPVRVADLRRGISRYREPGLLDSLQVHLTTGRVRFFDDLSDAARTARVVIVAVETVANRDGSTDLDTLRTVIAQLAGVPFAERPTIAVRSSVPPGTTDDLAALVESWGALICAPEFLRDGCAVYDFLTPDRIVAGCDATADAVPYVQLFEELQKPVVFTSRCNAELIKYCSNAYLAIKISFANEVAHICDAFAASADDVLRGVGYDPRIGADFLRPGLGFGGPLLARDVRGMAYIDRVLGLDCELIPAALRANDAQPRAIIERLTRELGSLDGAVLGVWGLAFKAGSGDVRDSPALRVVRELADRGAELLVFDPAVNDAALPPGSRMAATALAAANADALVVLTDWPEFGRIDPHAFATSLRRRLVLDARNVLSAERVAAAGLAYHGLGRPRRDGALARATVDV
jgi:UDPglucose 6-dehydrogenase